MPRYDTEDRPCEICGEMMVDPHPRKVKCGSKTCTREYFSRWNIQKKLGKPGHQPICKYCGKIIDNPRAGNQICCGAPECIRAQNRSYSTRKRMKMYNSVRGIKRVAKDKVRCLMCDNWFLSWDRILNRRCPPCEAIVKSGSVLSEADLGG